MASWIKKSFDATGVTEYPAGAGLDELQKQFGGGSVILALDVSGSMGSNDAGVGRNTQRLSQAVLGCKAFVREAVEARYEVGLILWDHGVVGSVAPDPSPAGALRLLDAAVVSGGTDVLPCLNLAHSILLSDPRNDMVVAIFGDGDLGDLSAAKAKAAELAADNIRIITCGLGDSSAETLAEISTEKSEVPRTASNDSIVESIASMAKGLVRK